MKKLSMFVLAALLGVALLWSTQDGYAQMTKGKTRAAATKQLMKGLVAANCGDLKKALEAGEVDWPTIELKAALLNESGYLLMDDGRCPDGEWAKAAKALREQSATLLEQAQAKDLAGAQSTFKELTAQSCAVCHKAHKPKS